MKKSRRRDSNRAIITIFGGTFGDDEALARDVATHLGCQFISREIFVAASKRWSQGQAFKSDNLGKDARFAKIVANRNLSATSIKEETKMERTK